MVYDWIASGPTSQNPRDHRVTDDRRVLTREGHPLRIIRNHGAAGTSRSGYGKIT